MNAITYHEPYKLPAGALALVVHAAFFALLYFGINWRTERPQGMVVELWESLSEPEAANVKTELPPVEQVEPSKPVELPKQVQPSRQVEPVQHEAPPKADIDLAVKKKPKAKPIEVKKPKPVEVKKPVQQKEAEQVTVDQKALAEQNARAEQERVRAEQAAAIDKVVDEFKAKIVAKIRRNIVMPPDVPDNARTEFDVTVLPGGSVLDVKLTRSSGKIAYDSAVERAIFKAQPLPLPPDAGLFDKFRELHLKFQPD